MSMKSTWLITASLGTDTTQRGGGMDPTEITANCPICGDVKLTGVSVRVTQYLDDEAASIYTFTCPKCHEEHVKPAPRPVRAALWTAYPRPEWTQEYLTPPP